ncbi:Lsm family RNA-binding protein [Thermoproteus tenax]|uniref:U6 snRNA-associated Sm-like protein LSm6 n=1 Tax=Thermoproteus tenax (strain ATCC 35583 / DSM 2078 / JCM 9277 / NBRC 100435 / Kra 1) TaxID=768679 RepID=G4RLV2_THETK|nr:Lsm family RNA-binding protein [Thermoproteus tenax]CCC82547.1 U6 snRNA-associated Sm-like protein LSm6 [Thermoproteus tenax Kra 1]
MSILAEANKRFVAEINSLLGKEVIVGLSNGDEYRGVLYAVDNQLNLILYDTTTKSGNKYSKSILISRYIMYINSIEKEVDLRSFAKYAEKYFPGMVKYIEESNIVLIGDKVRVSEIGIEGSGPLAERVRQIYEEFVKKRG